MRKQWMNPIQKNSTVNVENVNAIQQKTQKVTSLSGHTTEDCAADELRKQNGISQGATQLPVSSEEYPSNQSTDAADDYLKTKEKSKPKRQSTVDVFFNRGADDLKKKNKKL
ncbi:Hypothetical protein FKW44_008396 [Caligus rogercresseyi]|uniref:Uncharacterized protein n=1 Tax=Caligus rogercresseyi TaxID=217165 RepID=A0A7T8QU88_CALRO|nr:Hypothetical protein FKW44_008396 [Caligus rogercresseyi]